VLETWVSRTAVTDDPGRYLVIALPFGEYEVRAAKQGFQTAIRGGIRWAVGEEAAFALLLQVVTVTSKVTRRWSAPPPKTSAAWSANKRSVICSRTAFAPSTASNWSLRHRQFALKLLR